MQWPDPVQALKSDFAVYQLVLDKKFFKIIKDQKSDNNQEVSLNEIKSKFDQRHHKFFEDIPANDNQLIRIFYPKEMRTTLLWRSYPRRFK